MNKKEYLEPDMEISIFDFADIIVTSRTPEPTIDDFGDETNPDDPGNPPTGTIG